MNGTSHPGKSPRLTLAIQRNVARVLLADSDLASRLTLKTLLSKAGYAVDSAASASEAIDHLDAREYQLVLADLRTEPGEAGLRLLAYARQKEFRPATALMSSRMSEMDDESGDRDVTGTDVTGTDVTGTDVTGRDVTGRDR